MSPRRLALALLLVAGCQRLPSLVPLADSGGAELEPSSRIDRRAPGTRAGEDEGDAAEEGAGEVEVVASAEVETPDAGTVPDGAAPALPADGGAEPSWPGEYYGTDRFAWRGAGGREMVEIDERAHTRVEAAGPAAIVISIVNSATGEVICPLQATTSGNRATIREGETCFGSQDQAAVVTDGRATLEGDRLVLDFRGHLDAGEDAEEGEAEEGTYHFDGRRR